MAAVPDQIVLKRHRDLEGRARHPPIRRAILGILVVFLALAVANVFGQHPATSRASTPGIGTWRKNSPVTGSATTAPW